MKTPRPFTFERDCPRGPAITLGQIGYISGQLLLINALNDMVSSLAGFDQLPYLPGDLLACKLNLVKLKRPRRNPWYKPALCPCDKRAANANASLRPSRASGKKTSPSYHNPFPPQNPLLPDLRGGQQS